MLSTSNEIQAVQAVEAPRSDVAFGTGVELAGDWQSYKAGSHEAVALEVADARLALRRKLALRYLGKRAQGAGGVYNSTSPTVLSSIFIEQLRTENQQRRQSRYPWLGDLLAITEALERDQHANCNISASVISLLVRRPL